jgi:glycosyltransferase involved in cell wall biosynthesis
MSGWKPARPILMTVDPIGGVWTYALDLCRELGDCDIVLASMGKRLIAAERAQLKTLPHVDLCESDFKLEWMTDPWRDVEAAGEWLNALAATIRPSLVHLNQFSHGALDWNVPCLVVGHSCVYSWFQAVERRQPGDDWKKYKEKVSCGLRAADRVTAPSQWMLSALKEHYGRFAAAAPIYNGADGRRFFPGRKEHFILTAGRLWDRAKNIAILDAVAAKLAWPIYAAGAISGPDGTRADLKNLRLLGPLDAAALSCWLGRAEIFVLPALYEPFGLAALEAALAGCALVLGDIPSLREIWQDAALFVQPRDREAIAAALAALVSDKTLCGRLAGQARRRALEFTPRRTASAYLGLYRDMLAHRHPGAHGRGRPITPAESQVQP